MYGPRYGRRNMSAKKENPGNHTHMDVKAWFPLVLRIVRIGDFYDIPTSGILTTSGNTSSQKSQTVGNFYDVIGRIRIISTLKVLSQTSQTSAIFTMSVNRLS